VLRLSLADALSTVCSLSQAGRSAAAIARDAGHAGIAELIADHCEKGTK